MWVDVISNECIYELAGEKSPQRRTEIMGLSIVVLLAEKRAKRAKYWFYKAFESVWIDVVSNECI